MTRNTAVDTCLTFLVLTSWSISGVSQTLNEAVSERIDNMSGSFSILRNCSESIASQSEFGPFLGPAPPETGVPSPGSSSPGGLSLPISVPLLEMLSNRAIKTTTQRDKGLSGRPNQLVAGKRNVFASGVFAPFVIVEKKGLQRNESRYESSRDYVGQSIILGTTFKSPLRTITGLSVSGAAGKGELGERGDFSDDSYGLTVFTLIRVNQLGVLQLRSSFSKADHDRRRYATYSNDEFICNGTPKAEFASNELGVGLEYGQIVPIGRWALTFSASVDWNRTGIDTYTETYSQPNFDFNGIRRDELSGLELTFYGDKRDSIRSVTSVGLGRSLVLGRWTFQPTLILQWVHEYASNQQELEASLVLDPEQRKFGFLRDAIDRDYFVIGASASFGNDSMSWLLGYRTLFGYDHLSVDVITLGLNASFH